MPVLNLSIGAVNITNYLIISVAKSATPNVEETREVFPPEVLNTSFNVSITVGDASIYKVSYYESTDGDTLGQLLGSSTWDAKNKVQLSETLFYLTNGSRDVDPAEGSNIIADPYLDGKNITKVQKDIKLLVPPAYDFKQYDLYSGGGIQLLGTDVFNDEEITAIEVTYAQAYETNTSNAGMYDGWVKIATDTTLDNTHRNKRIKCEGTGSTLVITLETLSSVPDGKFYYFNSNGGTQKKVRILCAGTDKIWLQGSLIGEISIGKGEHVRLEKVTDGGSYWEAVDVHAGVLQVGERVAKGVADTMNLIPEDGSLIDGDEEPRLYRFVLGLPSTSKVTSSSVVLSNFTHSAGEEGKFYIHPTLKKFRMPNSQGWYYKGLDSYSIYSSREPGQTAQGQVGPHTHTIGSAYRNDSNGGDQPNTMYFGTDKGATPFGAPVTTDENTGTTTEVNNIGEIFLRRS